MFLMSFATSRNKVDILVEIYFMENFNSKRAVQCLEK